MTDTDRSYLHSVLCRACDTPILAVDEGGRVALEAAAFYATGGGQAHDTGRLARGAARRPWSMCGSMARWCGTRWSLVCRR